VLALTGDGVLLALPGQSPPAGQWPSLSDAVAELLAGGNGRGHVLVDVEALEGRELGERDVIPGCRPVTPGEIARTLARCERTLIF
jgi:sulfur relay (sulfurtransferase) DsrF/TusC family protein